MIPAFKGSYNVYDHPPVADGFLLGSLWSSLM